jgi:hypothetical protein
MNKKLGYYTCAGFEFESKIRAAEVATSINRSIEWNFNNEAFGSYNWSIEPELSLDQLYDLRARELREKYDYIILSYSGGSDSNNVLESFLRQGLFIDEIVTNWALDLTEKFTVLDSTERSTWNHNAEFKLHTASRLDYIKNSSPKTKITMIDTSEILVKNLLIADDASWVRKKKEVLNVTGSSQFNYVYFSDIRKRLDKSNRVALINGTDKPKVKILDSKLYLYFIDKAVNMVSIQDHIEEYPNAEPVFFYWDSDCCDLLCKQAHTILKWIKANPHHIPTWESSDPVVIRRVQEELLKTIVYPSTWNPKWFQVVKSIEDWDSELDYWFTKGWQGTREYHIWKQGLDYVASRVKNFLYYKDDGSVRGLRPYFSENYFIGTIK